jgi:hypothetical protein
LAVLAASSGQACQSPSGGSVVNGRRVKRLGQLNMAEAVLRYQRHAEVYYRGGTEYDNLKIAGRPILELYADLPVEQFGPPQFKTVWEIRLVDHKTAWRGHEPIIYVPAKAQTLLVPFLLRGADDPCFSTADNKYADDPRRAYRQAANA